jgi:hypothetical protein
VLQSGSPILPQQPSTDTKVQTQRIKYEIKFLYKKKRKKEKLNFELYPAHLKAAHEWNGTRLTINEHIQSNTNSESTRKYGTIHDKLDKLTRLQTKTPTSSVNFYTHAVNKPDITFTPNELSLLNKGLKYVLSIM